MKGLKKTEKMSQNRMQIESIVGLTKGRLCRSCSLGIYIEDGFVNVDSQYRIDDKQF